MARPASISSAPITMSTSPGAGISDSTGVQAVGACGRQHLDVIDRGAGALRDAGHRGRLREPALRLGKRDDPVGQHAAALAAHRQHGDGDRLVGVERDGGRVIERSCAALKPRTRRGALVAPALQEADHGAAQPRHEAIERRSGLWMMSAR